MRHTRDPYKIWISEVVMQQTRMNQGLPYYLRFIEAFPDVKSLAAAPEDEVLKKWQGLGYYNRARNLQKAARLVTDRWGGKMPGSYAELLKLNGVGKYTAAAIASICYDEPFAAVDGNVSRVIARLYGVEEPVNTPTGEKLINALAQELLDPGHPGTHNQAMIDFGALQCVPVSPACAECPLAGQCEAYGSGRVNQLPVKLPKKRPVDHWIWFYILLCNGETILTRRGTGDIWKSLYHFPAQESERALPEHEFLRRASQTIPLPSTLTLSVKKISPVIKHQLTHRTLYAQFIHVETERWPEPLPPDWIKITLAQLDDFPVPRLINRYMESFIF